MYLHMLKYTTYCDIFVKYLNIQLYKINKSIVILIRSWLLSESKNSFHKFLIYIGTYTARSYVISYGILKFEKKNTTISGQVAFCLVLLYFNTKLKLGYSLLFQIFVTLNKRESPVFLGTHLGVRKKRKCRYTDTKMRFIDFTRRCARSFRLGFIYILTTCTVYQEDTQNRPQSITFIAV